MSVAEKFDIRTPLHFSFALALLGIIYILYIYEKERKLKQCMLFLAELRPREVNELHTSTPASRSVRSCFKLSLRNINSLLHPFISHFPALNSCPRLHEGISTSCAYHRKQKREREKSMAVISHHLVLGTTLRICPQKAA